MTGVAYKRNDCRLCGGTNLDLVLPLEPVPVVDEYVPEGRVGQEQPSYPIDVYLCSSCGHAQLMDIVDPEVLYGDYIYETTSSLGLVEHFQEYAEDLLSRVGPKPGSLVVDIGSNDGTLLRFFQQKGMSVLGVDPASEIAARATSAGVETLPLFFNPETARNIKGQRGQASVITMNNLFANVDELDEVAEAIRLLLAPEGVFVFETFYMAELVRNMVFDLIYHEHLNCFTVKPLQAFFPRHGMELIEVDRVETKGGSLRCTVQLAGGLRKVSQSVAKFISDETALGIHSPNLYEDFGARIDSVKNKLADTFAGLDVKDKVIAGYGASATTTTLLYHFNIGQHISFMVDDNLSKQGRFSPGLHIPVYPSSALYERKPDYVVLLAWRFADHIVSNHQAYLDSGGHFIIPLPEVSLV